MLVELQTEPYTGLCTKEQPFYHSLQNTVHFCRSDLLSQHTAAKGYTLNKRSLGECVCVQMCVWHLRLMAPSRRAWVVTSVFWAVAEVVWGSGMFQQAIQGARNQDPCYLSSLLSENHDLRLHLRNHQSTRPSPSSYASPVALREGEVEGEGETEREREPQHNSKNIQSITLPNLGETGTRVSIMREAQIACHRLETAIGRLVGVTFKLSNQEAKQNVATPPPKPNTKVQHPPEGHEKEKKHRKRERENTKRKESPVSKVVKQANRCSVILMMSSEREGLTLATSQSENEKRRGASVTP